MLKRLCLLLTGFTLIAGCGGGGGGGSATSIPAAYTGKTAQATVSTANAKTLSTAAYNGGGAASLMGAVGKAAADTGTIPSPLLQEVFGALEDSATSIAQQPKSSAKTVESVRNTQNTVNGYSGSFSYNFDIDTVSGAVNGTETFSKYQASSDSLTMSGTVTVSGVYNPATSSYTSISLTMTSLNCTLGSWSFTLSGNLASSVSGTTKTETFTLATTDNVAHITTLAYNYNVTYTGTSLTLSGSYYDPAEGYLTVGTVTPLVVSSLTATPTAGQLLFTGSNGTKVRMTFASGGSNAIEADTAGNGTFVVVP